MPLPPGSHIGILGGGQLGQMLAVAAGKLGYKTHIYCPDPDSPAFAVATRHTIAAYDDAAALKKFADSVDVITYEFENIPVEPLREIKNKIRPSCVLHRLWHELSRLPGRICILCPTRGKSGHPGAGTSVHPAVPTHHQQEGCRRVCQPIR